VASLLRLLAVAAAALCAAAPAGAYSFEQIAEGFRDPTYVTSAPGDASTLYVVERAGTIRVVRGGAVVGTLLDIADRVWSEGEGGLLSVAFHPRYATNHLFYVDYTDLDRDTHVAEYRADVGGAAFVRDLLFVEQVYPNHKGGQLQFDREGRLYVGMGDGGSNPDSPLLNDPDNQAQNLTSRLGKLLRTRVDGAPSWQMVAYGLRNPWRFSFDRVTGDLWLGDVGAGGYEEVNFRPHSALAALTNFGWSHFEGPSVYNRKVKLRGNGKLVGPIWTYGHQQGSCSIIGGYVYRGAPLPAARGRYFFGDFCSGIVWSFKVGKSGRASAVTKIEGTVPDLTSFGADADGDIYATSFGGVLYALR
jgi:glucose/arabinose dehydrogenase